MFKNWKFYHWILAIGVVVLVLNMCHDESDSDSSKQSAESSVQTVLDKVERISKSDLRSMVYDRDYKKACEVKEFNTAYEIVDKLIEETNKAKAQWKSEQGLFARKGDREKYQVEYEAAKKKSSEAEKYVILQESLFVLESDDPNSLVRIVGIAKEHNAEDWLYSELIDIEEKVGNSELVEKLKKMNKK